MNTYSIFSLSGLVLTILFPLCTFSQTYKTDNNKSGDKIEIAPNMSPDVLAGLIINTNPNPKNAIIAGNSVYLQQIGDYNTTRIVTRTNASEINVTQNGDYNDTHIDYTANTAIVDLVQNGNSNRFRDVVNDPDANISVDLVQEGSYLNFEREGVNELTKSLKFRQTEASPTIIVRSYY